MSRPVSVPCGEQAAYKRALRNKAQGKPHCGPCDECKAANAKYQREHYRRVHGIA